MGRYEGAVEALDEAEENGTPSEFVGYQLAGAHALRGDTELALEALEKALQAAFSRPEELVSDEAFVGLREDARFHRALERARINARPCELLPQYREFDFWLGEWSVSSAGRNAGTNIIVIPEGTERAVHRRGGGEQMLIRQV